MTDQELETLLEDIESHAVERKESLGGDARDTIRQAIVQQHAVRLDRPVKAYARWMDRIPGQYRESVLDSGPEPGVHVNNDPYCLAMLKNYRSLMPLAQEARKPMFHLKTADGAMGSHATAALEVYRDYTQLARQIAARCKIILPAGA